jgi:hypothetical protein
MGRGKRVLTNPSLAAFGGTLSRRERREDAHSSL